MNCQDYRDPNSVGLMVGHTLNETWVHINLNFVVNIFDYIVFVLVVGDSVANCSNCYDFAYYYDVDFDVNLNYYYY